MDGPVSLTVVIRTTFFYYGDYGECRIVLDRPRVPHLRLVFDNIEDFVDGERQRSEVLFHLEGLGWIRREDQEEHLSFVGWLPPIRAISMGWSSVSRLRLLPIVAAFESPVDRALHCFFQLDVRLGSERDLIHPRDAVLQ